MSIAIDGPAASGKTVIGRLLARRLGYRFLDTGAMYRAVTWAVIRQGIDLNDGQMQSQLARELDIRPVSNDAGDRLTVNGEDVTNHLRDPEVDRGVSLSARVPGVRSALVDKQRSIASGGSIVMVGRDIGTVVLVDADVKVYLNASAEVRARRRLQEMEREGRNPDYKQVLDDLVRRDMIDSKRANSPLRPADDAIQIDTDDLEVDDVAGIVLSILETA